MDDYVVAETPSNDNVQTETEKSSDISVLENFKESPLVKYKAKESQTCRKQYLVGDGMVISIVQNGLLILDTGNQANFSTGF